MDKTSIEFSNQKNNYEKLIERIGPAGASILAAEKIVLFTKNQAK